MVEERSRERERDPEREREREREENVTWWKSALPWAELQASSFEITTLNDDIQEVADLERGFATGQIQPPEVPPISGIWTRVRDYLSKAKRFKPHQPRPSENAEPELELEPPSYYGEVKEAKGVSSKVRLATQMVFPAAVGWGGYFVIGQGALYNPAFAFSVFGLHTLGILSMFIACLVHSLPCARTDPRFQQAQVVGLL